MTDVKVNKETGMLEYTITNPGTVGITDEDFAPVHYMTGFTVRVMATDSNNDVTAENTVKVMLNQAPRVKSMSVIEGISGDVIVLGNTAAKRRNFADDTDTPLGFQLGTRMACPMINECVLDAFEDDGDITVIVTGMTRDGKANSGLVSWTPTDDDNVKLIGMASTWDGDEYAHSSVTVNLKAIDTKGLEMKAAVLVNVDAAPTISTPVGQSIAGSLHEVKESKIITSSVSGLFANAEGGVMLGYTEGSSNDKVASSEIGDGNGGDGALTIMGATVNQNATITVTAKEPEDSLHQSVELEFTVRVTEVVGS